VKGFSVWECARITGLALSNAMAGRELKVGDWDSAVAATKDRAIRQNARRHIVLILCAFSKGTSLRRCREEPQKLYEFRASFPESRQKIRIAQIRDMKEMASLYRFP
jgi:hypothetical protein